MVGLLFPFGRVMSCNKGMRNWSPWIGQSWAERWVRVRVIRVWKRKDVPRAKTSLWCSQDHVRPQGTRHRATAGLAALSHDYPPPRSGIWADSSRMGGNNMMFRIQWDNILAVVSYAWNAFSLVRWRSKMRWAKQGGNLEGTCHRLPLGCYESCNPWSVLKYLRIWNTEMTYPCAMLYKCMKCTPYEPLKFTDSKDEWYASSLQGSAGKTPKILLVSQISVYKTASRKAWRWSPSRLHMAPQGRQISVRNGSVDRLWWFHANTWRTPRSRARFG